MWAGIALRDKKKNSHSFFLATKKKFNKFLHIDHREREREIFNRVVKKVQASIPHLKISSLVSRKAFQLTKPSSPSMVGSFLVLLFALNSYFGRKHVFFFPIFYKMLPLFKFFFRGPSSSEKSGGIKTNKREMKWKRRKGDMEWNFWMCRIWKKNYLKNLNKKKNYLKNKSREKSH